MLQPEHGDENGTLIKSNSIQIQIKLSLNGADSSTITQKQAPTTTKHWGKH